jgi:hypothetical protein
LVGSLVHGDLLRNAAYGAMSRRVRLSPSPAGSFSKLSDVREMLEDARRLLEFGEYPL